MKQYLFLPLFLGFGFLNLIIGLFGARNVKNKDDYFLAGRSLGLLPVTLTLLATQIGGGMLLGTAQEAYKIGFYGLMYAFGMVLGFIILSLGLAAKLRELRISTTSEVFELKYNSPMLNKVASFFSAATLFGIVVGQVIASRLLLYSLGIENELILIIFWLFIIIYATVGGLKAVIFTDSFQVIFVTLVFIGIFLYVLYSEAGSFFSLPSIIEQQKLFAPMQINPYNTLIIILMPALFSLIGQDIAQRFFAAKNKYIATFAAIFATLFLIIFSIIPIYFGIKAKALGLVGNPILQLVGQFTNEIVLIFASFGIIAAITSTGDSILVAISSNLAQPFNVKNKLKLARVITIVTGIAAFGFSYVLPQDTLHLILESFEISVSCLLVPLLFGYFKDNLNKNAALFSIAFGLSGFILFRIYPITFPKEIASIALSLAGYFIGDKIKT